MESRNESAEMLNAESGLSGASGSSAGDGGGASMTVAV
jgi:hypothetical protein